MTGSQVEYSIAGIQVVFPHKAYGPQLAYMGKVLTALQSAYAGGDGNALLESPTGSGKTLALLCATLAWQRHCKANLGKNVPVRVPPPSAFDPAVGGDDYLGAGGGFMPETTTPEVAECKGGDDVFQDTPVPAPERKKAPQIIYTTRTHSQITQVIKELHTTSYRVPMAILAARKHYCTNAAVCAKKNYDEDCKLLLKAEEDREHHGFLKRVKEGARKDEPPGCREFRNVNKVKMHPSIQQGGKCEVHDIEDLVGIAREVKGCAYFAARALAEEAQIIFCPYNYIVNPLIRSAMEVDINGAIIVMDEAHNIEDVSREAGSFTVEVDQLSDLKTELSQLITAAGVEYKSSEIYEPLLEMFEGLVGWIEHRSNHLTRIDSSTYASWWGGSNALQELRSAGIMPELFPVLLQCCRQAVKAVSDPNPKVAPISAWAANIMEGMFCVLNFMVREDARRIDDYQVVLRRSSRWDEGNRSTEWVTTLNLWCLNPAVVFEELAQKSLSVILTSGTLSPMGSFASELGVNFLVQLEAPHVVNMDTQVWAAAMAVGPGMATLNASYQNAMTVAFQDGLGLAIEEILKVIPDGVLIFFPSYKLLENLVAKWRASGQWKRFQREKQLFVEPRGSQDGFEQVLTAYYAAVNGVKLPVSGSKPRNSSPARSHPVNPCTMQTTGGAAFFAVFRGKVSEGLNFADHNARAVVVVGIPFPNIMDLQVKLKKIYNSEHKVVKKLLSGDEWYCQQAFRALNQAVGRCIRHREDYGAIILLDERLQKQSNLNYLSKWLRQSVKRVESFENSLTDVQKFFQSMKIRPEEASVVTPLRSLPPSDSFLQHFRAADSFLRHRYGPSTTTGQASKSKGPKIPRRKRKATDVTIKEVEPETPKRTADTNRLQTNSSFCCATRSDVSGACPIVQRKKSSAAALSSGRIAAAPPLQEVYVQSQPCPGSGDADSANVRTSEELCDEDDFFCTQVPPLSVVPETPPAERSQWTHVPRTSVWGSLHVSSGRSVEECDRQGKEEIQPSMNDRLGRDEAPNGSPAPSKSKLKLRSRHRSSGGTLN